MRNVPVVSVTRSFILATTGCILVCAGSASAQSTDALSQPKEPGASCLQSIDPTRVSRDHTMTVLRRDGGTLRGHLYELNDHEISIRPLTSGVTTVSVPLENVETLSYGRIGEKKPSKIGMCAAIGCAIGFLIGYTMADTEKPDPNDFIVVSEDTQRTMSGMVFCLIGAGMGALVGVGLSAPDVTPVEVQCMPAASFSAAESSSASP